MVNNNKTKTFKQLHLLSLFFYFTFLYDNIRFLFHILKQTIFWSIPK